MSYSFKFVRTVNGKTVEEKYPDNQSAHTAMGYYAAEHGLNVQCVQGRFLETSKSVMYEGKNPYMGGCGYVCWDVDEGHTGRVRESKPKTKIKKRKSS